MVYICRVWGYNIVVLEFDNNNPGSPGGELHNVKLVVQFHCNGFVIACQVKVYIFMIGGDSVSIRDERIKSGKRIGVVCKELGVSRTTWWKWERQFSFPKSSRLPGLAEYFGCSVDALLSK